MDAARSVLREQYNKYLDYLRRKNDRTVMLDDGSIVDDVTPTIEEFAYMLKINRKGD